MSMIDTVRHRGSSCVTWQIILVLCLSKLKRLMERPVWLSVRLAFWQIVPASVSDFLY